jgi:hypothetical protein
MFARLPGWCPALVAALQVACAHAPAPTPAVPHVKLAVLPVESEAAPQLAAALNASMRVVRIDGVNEYFVSGVPLEVVQLSIECVAASPACYTATGKSLGANRLLLALVDPGKKKHHDKTFRIVVTFFDVDAGAPLKIVDRTFPNRNAALTEVDALVKEAVDIAGTATRPSS